MTLSYAEIAEGEFYFLKGVKVQVINKHSAIIGDLADEKSEPRYIYCVVDDPDPTETRTSCPYAGNELTLVPQS